MTYLDPELGLDISAAGGFEINGVNEATDYHSGNALHFDISISKYLTKELSVGVLAGHYQQISSDGGEGARSGAFKGRVTGIGGTVAYTFMVGQTSVSTRLKVLREIDVENRPQGTVALFTVAFPIGGQAPPQEAAAARIRARY